MHANPIRPFKSIAAVVMDQILSITLQRPPSPLGQVFNLLSAAFVMEMRPI
jgi:hypothetical protein